MDVPNSICTLFLCFVFYISKISCRDIHPFYSMNLWSIMLVPVEDLDEILL